MSFYNRKSSSDAADDNVFYSRKIQQGSIYDSDCNINGNNNTENNDIPKSRLSVSENGKRYSGSKSPGRSRKSKLIETMAANFEKKGSDNHPTRNSSRRITSNGESNPSPTAKETPRVVLNNNEKSPTDDPASPDDKKATPSSKRGKSQRSRRMIRQKRRSTGVVNKEDLEELEQTNSTVAELDLQKQTDDNTQTNEVSPEVVSPKPERLTSVPKNHVSSRKNVARAPAPSDPIQDTPRRLNGVEHTPVKNHNAEVQELRAKLETAEFTISRLRQEIKLMDQELHILEDENDQLKMDNKMLEDENRTMLRIIRS